MPDAHDTLAIFAEVAVGLAGFSGIVIAFGRRSTGALTRLERRRLSNLFTLSGTALALCLIGISLLHIDFARPELLWISGSAVMILVITPWFIGDIRKLYRLEVGEKAQINITLIVCFDLLAVAMLLLQLGNVFVIQQQWPFFLALTLTIVGAFQQFILLVMAGMQDRHSDND